MSTICYTCNLVRRVHFLFALQMKYGTLLASNVWSALHTCVSMHSKGKRERTHNSNTHTHSNIHRSENVDQFFSLFMSERIFMNLSNRKKSFSFLRFVFFLFIFPFLLLGCKPFQPPTVHHSSIVCGLYYIKTAYCFYERTQSMGSRVH